VINTKKGLKMIMILFLSILVLFPGLNPYRVCTFPKSLHNKLYEVNPVINESPNHLENRNDQTCEMSNWSHKRLSMESHYMIFVSVPCIFYWNFLL